MTEEGKTVYEQVRSLPPLEELLKAPKHGVDRSDRLKAARASGANRASTALTAAVDPLYLKQNEAQAWASVRKSLELAVLYRSDADIALTLHLLRQVPLLEDLASDDLLCVAEVLQLTTTAGSGTLLYEIELVDDDEDYDAIAALAASISSSEDGDEKALAAKIEQRLADKTASAAAAENEDDKGSDEAGSSADGSENASSRPKTADEEEGEETTSSGDPQREGESATEKNNRSDEVDDSEEVIYFLVSGKSLLELPTVVGRQHFPVQPLDAFGGSFLSGPLPPGSKYITTEPCMYARLRFDRSDAREAKVLQRIHSTELERRRRFLLESLSPKMFDHCEESRLTAVCSRLLPLRLCRQQLVLEEDTEADRLFFVREGAISVNRFIHVKPPPRKLQTVSTDGGAQQPSGKHAKKAGGSREPYELFQDRSDPDAGKHVMEVATLRPGDIFGELALLAYNPNQRPGSDVQWSDDYWRHALRTRFKDGATASTRGADNTAGSPAAASAGQPPLLSGGNAAMELTLNRLPKPAKRLATLYAKTETVLYSLAFADCEELLPGAPLATLREFVKGYPSLADIFEQFENQRRWRQYKDQTIADVMYNNPNKRVKAKLPPIKM